MGAVDEFELADYRLRVAAIYSRARAAGGGTEVWEQWVAARDELFRTHPQSAIANQDRASFSGLPYSRYDPAYRLEAELLHHQGDPQDIRHSGAGSTEFVPLGIVSLEQLGIDENLTVYWLTSYGGGIFLPFRDGTSGFHTYGGGRYLVDSVKGAYLGGSRTSLILDFNYAYHPSCVYSDAWSCPLAPRENHLSAHIPVGEQLLQ